MSCLPNACDFEHLCFDIEDMRKRWRSASRNSMPCNINITRMRPKLAEFKQTHPVD